MDAAYYRRLAQDLMSDAAAAQDKVLAARLRQQAQEYLILAETMEDADARRKTQDGDQQQQRQSPHAASRPRRRLNTSHRIRRIG